MSDNESCRNHVSTDNGGAVDREHPESMCGNLANAVVIGESSAKSDCVERLYKRLAICESTINQLFTTRKSGSILKEKLIAVDELILDIPSQDTQLAAEWREKVANWWTQFAAAVEPSNAAAAAAVAGNSDGTATESSGNPQQDKRQPMQNRPPMNSTFGPNGSRTFFSNSRFQPNFRPNMPPHHHDGGSGGGGGAGAAAAREARESTRRKFASVEEYNAERDKVRSQLCAEFENVKPLESGQSFDIDSLKRLNLVVRMARNLTHPFDAALKEEMFCHGYRKLTAEKREKFLEQYGSNRMLLNLAIFLRQQVDSCFQDLEIFKSLDGRGRSFRRFPKFAANLSQPQAPRAPQPNESVSNLASTSPDSIASIDANNNEAGTGSPGTTTATGSPDAGGDSGINSTTTNAVSANQISKPSISAVNRGRREYGGKAANYGGNGGPRRSYTKICFNCKRPGHLSKFCKSQKATMIAGFNVSANSATITTTTSNDAAEGEAAVSAEAGVEAPNCSSGDSEKIAISGGGAKDDNNSGNNNRDEDDDLGFAITTDSEVTTA